MAYILDKNAPIAVFDSGMGGISVLKELAAILPNEDFIYFGDSANAPYGTRHITEVRNLTCRHAENFFDEGAKGLVVACNTATSAAVRTLREQYPEIPIVGIEPAVKPAAHFREHPRVLVMATPITVRGEKFHILMQRYENDAEIIPLACPGLMDFVERGDLGSVQLQQYLQELLHDYMGNKVDAAVMGCTHYPFLKRTIQKTLGDKVQLFDGGAGTAREMKRRLTAAGLLNTSGTPGSIQYRNSLPDPEKIRLCRFLFEDTPMFNEQ